MGYVLRSNDRKFGGLVYWFLVCDLLLAASLSPLLPRFTDSPSGSPASYYRLFFVLFVGQVCEVLFAAVCAWFDVFKAPPLFRAPADGDGESGGSERTLSLAVWKALPKSTAVGVLFFGLLPLAVAAVLYFHAAISSSVGWFHVLLPAVVVHRWAATLLWRFAIVAFSASHPGAHNASSVLLPVFFYHTLLSKAQFDSAAFFRAPAYRSRLPAPASPAAAVALSLLVVAPLLSGASDAHFPGLCFVLLAAAAAALFVAALVAVGLKVRAAPQKSLRLAEPYSVSPQLLALPVAAAAPQSSTPPLADSSPGADGPVVTFDQPVDKDSDDDENAKQADDAAAAGLAHDPFVLPLSEQLKAQLYYDDDQEVTWVPFDLASYLGRRIVGHVQQYWLARQRADDEDSLTAVLLNESPVERLHSSDVQARLLRPLGALLLGGCHALVAVGGVLQLHSWFGDSSDAGKLGGCLALALLLLWSANALLASVELVYAVGVFHRQPVGCFAAGMGALLAGLPLLVVEPPFGLALLVVGLAAAQAAFAYAAFTSGRIRLRLVEPPSRRLLSDYCYCNIETATSRWFFAYHLGLVALLVLFGFVSKLLSLVVVAVAATALSLLLLAQVVVAANTKPPPVLIT